MTQTPASLDALLTTIVLATLAVGLPILVVMSIRLLWDRRLNLGRSKELEKLIWQLHRIASAMEHQLNLSYPAVQPGTEEPEDLVYLRELATQAKVAPRRVAAPSVAAAATANQATAQPPAVAATAAEQPAAPATATPAPATPEPAAQPGTIAPRASQGNGDEVPRHAGVNSMFGF